MITEVNKLTGFARQRPTVRERRERLWIAKLKSLPCFEQLVAKLVEGQSVTSVTRWLHGLGVDGELKNCGYHTLRQYVTALRFRVRENLAHTERKDVEPLAFRTVMQEFERQKDAEIAEEPQLTEASKKIWKVVSEAVKKLDAETMLKYCFMVQQGRVEAMLAIENKMGLPLPDVYKNIAVLKDIATEIRKYEVGELWMKGKAGAAYGGPYPGGFLSRAGAQEKELSPIALRLSELEPTDRNLIRAASERVVELIQEEMGTGSIAKVLEVDAEGVVAAETEIGNSDFGPASAV